MLPYGAGKLVLESDPIDAEGSLLTGYCESKWVAESTVRLAMQRGMRGAIYRPGLTLGEGDPARDAGLLAGILLLARKVGSLPRLAIPVDVVHAGYVAAAIARISADPRAEAGTFHLTHPEPVALADLLAEACGGVIALQPYEAWRARLELILPAIEDERAAALGALIVTQDEPSITPAAIDCRETLRLLRGTGVRCPPVREILAPMLRRALLPGATRTRTRKVPAP